MPRKTKLSPEDIALFRREVGPVNPMRRHDRADLGGKRNPPVRLPRHGHVLAPSDTAEFSDAFEPAETESGADLSFLRPGLPRTQFRKMRKGQYAIRSELDLHGMSAAEARNRVAAFLQDCRRRGERCVRIIHGKGHNSPNQQPILKGKLNIWLRQCRAVLAFCSAPARDGGTGAAYVLLSAL